MQIYFKNSINIIKYIRKSSRIRYLRNRKWSFRTAYHCLKFILIEDLRSFILYMLQNYIFLIHLIRCLSRNSARKVVSNLLSHLYQLNWKCFRYVLNVFSLSSSYAISSLVLLTKQFHFNMLFIFQNPNVIQTVAMIVAFDNKLIV